MMEAHVTSRRDALKRGRRWPPAREGRIHSQSASVRARGLSKVFESRSGERIHALGPLNFEIQPGSFVACVGPSGCGKSTLLALVAALMPPTRGRIFIDHREVLRPHPKVGVVFQDDMLLYWRSAIDNVLLPVEIKGLDRARYREVAKMLLTQVGLGDFADARPSELSGGMRQRVALCRALIQEPGLLLMDEPFGALDALTREQMIVDLQRMWLHLGNTVLFITHDIGEAVFLADRVLVMSLRPGRIVLDIDIDLGRPRRFDAINEEPEFRQYVQRIRNVFRSEGILRDA